MESAEFGGAGEGLEGVSENWGGPGSFEVEACWKSTESMEELFPGVGE